MKQVLTSKYVLQGQQGISLLELLISMLIGLFILGATLSLFVSMIKADSDYIKTIQLNQELRSVMSLITRDIRRAGSNRNAAVNGTAVPPLNPFSVDGTTRLAIAANQQGDPNSCVTYSYDSNEANSNYGFRLDSVNHVVETRSNGAACNAAGWTDVTDNLNINIEALTFTDMTVTEMDINLRQITVTLTGSLVYDQDVNRTLSASVKVRNDEF